MQIIYIQIGLFCPSSKGWVCDPNSEGHLIFQRVYELARKN